MSKYLQDTSNYLAESVQALKSPRSVARAYAQYLKDKTEITSKVLSVVGYAVSIQEDSNTLSVGTGIRDAIDQAGLRPDKAVLTAGGDIVSIEQLAEAIAVEKDGVYGELNGILAGTTVDIEATIDDLVDSYQASKIFESAFTLIDTSIDGAKVSISDIDTRIKAMGLTLTTRASEILVTVGDIMSDATSGVMAKIASISSIISFRSDDIDSSTESKINIPDFSTEDMGGISPINSFVNGIDLSINVGNIVNVVKKTTKIIGGFFKKASKVAQVGWNTAKNFVDTTFVNPIDFVVSDPKSTSHIVDVPFVNITLGFNEIRSLTRDSGLYENSMSGNLKNMRIGSMKSTYTPYAIFNIVRNDQDSWTFVGHLIPSKPLYEAKGMGGLQQSYGLKSDGINLTWGDAETGRSLPTLYEEMILNDGSNGFIHKGDDDPYYFAALAASLYRTSLYTAMANTIMMYNFIKPWDISDKSMQDVYEQIGDLSVNKTLAQVQHSRIYPNAWNDNYEEHIDYGWLKVWDYNLREYILEKQVDSFVTNSQFVHLIQDYVIAEQLIPSIMVLSNMNNYEFMETFFNVEPDVPPFIPSLVETSYQTPMYSIVTDSKHGDKVKKVFKGLVVVAAVVVGSVIAVKVGLNIKKNMNIAKLRLAGLQRELENMDPDDEHYMDMFNAFRKQSKKFDRKNYFLSNVGLGVKKTASGDLRSFTGVESFIPSNKNVIDLLV